MNNKVLVYDDNCPLCCWYSGLFVKCGFLGAEGRKAFSKLDDNLLSAIDFHKGRNEIPLLDLSTGKVLYGIDALLEILGQKLPFIKTTGNSALFKWFLERLYRLISYNRKVIVAKKCSRGVIDCSPDTNYFYRLVFLAICLAFNTLMLWPVQHNLFARLSYYSLGLQELQTAHLAFVLINCALAFTFSKEKGFEYIGQVNMLALTAILLMLPLMMLHEFFFVELFSTGWLIVTSAFIFKEYARRMAYAGVLPEHDWIVSMNLLSLTGFLLYLFT